VLLIGRRRRLDDGLAAVYVGDGERPADVKIDRQSRMDTRPLMTAMSDTYTTRATAARALVRHR